MSHFNSDSALPQGTRPRLLRALGCLARMVVPKSLYRINDDLQVPRPVPRVNIAALCVFLGLIIVPFAIEAISLLVAQWFNVMDKRLVVQTPLLDLGRAKIAECWDAFGSWTACLFEEANWSPHRVLPIVAVLLFIAARMLKK